MKMSERLMICGMASLLHPASILELGVYLGKCSEQLSKLTPIVYCVDPMRHEELALPSNCYFIQLTSDEFFKCVAKNNTYDLIIVDADHTEENAYRDLKNSIQYGKYILMHDSANPECRQGYKKAIRECGDKIKFKNLDLLPCSYVSTKNVQWGGLGIVVTK